MQKNRRAKTHQRWQTALQYILLKRVIWLKKYHHVTQQNRRSLLHHLVRTVNWHTISMPQIPIVAYQAASQRNKKLLMFQLLTAASKMQCLWNQRLSMTLTYPATHQKCLSTSQHSNCLKKELFLCNLGLQIWPRGEMFFLLVLFCLFL